MKTFFTSASALVLLLLPEMSRGAAANGWVNVFVNETSSNGGNRYEYVIQNRSDVAITAVEIGRKSACFGAPALDPSTLADKSLFQAPSGWTSSIREGDGGGSFVRFEGRSTDKRLSGFTIVGNNPALSSGFVCIYRSDAKVWQYKAAIIKDNVAPQITLSLNPASLQSDTLFHEINATISGSDDVDTMPQIKLRSITSSRSDFVFSREVKDAVIGTDDRKFQVLADKVGSFIVEYEISDAAGNQAFASATVVIKAGADKVAPTLTVALSPNSIPASNKLENITATITVKDNVDPAPSVKLLSITSDARDFNASTDVKNAVYNSDDRSFQLMAERSNNTNRVYKITYEAKDAAGNKATVTQTVTITAEQKSLLEQIVTLVVSLVKALLSFFF